MLGKYGPSNDELQNLWGCRIGKQGILADCMEKNLEDDARLRFLVFIFTVLWVMLTDDIEVVTPVILLKAPYYAPPSTPPG
ncbi:hypothetical protein Tco_0722456 [Tanacetum coccineum]